MPNDRSMGEVQTRGPTADVADRCEWVRACLKDLDADPEAVRQAIAALSEEDLNHFGLHSFQLNYLSAFGETLPLPKIHSLAAEAARDKLWCGWEYYSYITHLERDPLTPRLAAFDPAALTALRSGGRGLVICTCHLGDYRHVPSDLAIAEMETVTAMDADAYGQFLRTREANPHLRLWQFLRATNVEEPRGAMTLARVLARGGTIFAYIDGNSGTDGPLGEAGRTEVEMFGYPVRVKNGMARLAARFGSPLLPVLAVRIGGRGTFLMDSVIDPQRALKGDDQEELVARAMARIYAFFERGIREHPEQWETSCFFHRWRSAALASVLRGQPVGEAREELLIHLAAGGVLRVSPKRIVEIRGERETIWTDVKTLKAYRAPAVAQGLLAHLFLPEGVDLTRIRGLGAEAYESAVAFLALLKSREVLLTDRPS